MIIPFSLALTRLHLEHNAWFLVLQYKKHVESSMGALQRPGNKKGERLRELGCFFLEKEMAEGTPRQPPSAQNNFTGKGKPSSLKCMAGEQEATSINASGRFLLEMRGLLCTVKISITKLRAARSEFSICCGSSRRLDY